MNKSYEQKLWTNDKSFKPKLWTKDVNQKLWSKVRTKFLLKSYEHKLCTQVVTKKWWCHSCPRRPLSKGTNVHGTVVQGDFGPRRLLSKEAITSDKLAQIIFSLLYWIFCYWTKVPWTKWSLDNFFLGQMYEHLQL